VCPITCYRKLKVPTILLYLTGNSELGTCGTQEHYKYAHEFLRIEEHIRSAEE
jgi:hypothetical protein